jgi:hypothetical protein
LERNQNIIPVLWEGAPMPNRSDLPEAIRDLHGHNVVEYRHYYHRDSIRRLVQYLFEGLERVRDRKTEAGSSKESHS